MSAEVMSEVSVTETTSNESSSITVDGVPEPTTLPESPISDSTQNANNNESAEGDSATQLPKSDVFEPVSETIPEVNEYVAKQENITESSEIVHDKNSDEEAQIDVGITDTDAKTSGTVPEAEGNEDVSGSDTKQDNSGVLQRLTRSVLIETLLVWLIMFDYSIIFPCKVAVNRFKQEAVEKTRDCWTSFATKVANFQIMLTRCPEFGLVFIVFCIECLFLMLNVKRTAYCLRKMYQTSELAGRLRENKGAC